MARKPKTPRAAPASSAAELRVKMTAAFTYQLGPSARRTLPAGWSGMVPAAIATRLEAEKAGARVSVEEEPDAGVAATAKPPKPAATSAPDPAATIPAAPAAAESGAPAAPAGPEVGGASDATPGGGVDPAADKTGD